MRSDDWRHLSTEALQDWHKQVVRFLGREDVGPKSRETQERINYELLMELARRGVSV